MNKHFFRRVSLLLFILVIIFSAGCSKTTKVNSSVPVMTANELSVYDKTIKKSIYIGMTKNDVEKTIGEASNVQNENGGKIYLYDNLSIVYTDDAITWMAIGDNDSSYDNFNYNTDISLGEKKDDVVKKLGSAAKETPMKSSNKELDLYYYLAKGKNLTKVQMPQKPTEGYGVVFTYSGDKLDEVMITNYNANK
ncbi:MAG: hypothetical protein Q8900_05405 [Bacillota bacterium]|nr:hypothetical protein [Bacillota bacterium]